MDYDIYAKTTEELLNNLRKLIELDECDQTCDEEFPYLCCDICETKYFLNDLGDNVKAHYKNLQQLERYRHNK